MSPSASTPAAHRPPSLVVIANPSSGRGRGARVVRALEARLANSGGASANVSLQLTRFPGEEQVLAREAALGGAHTILAVGGDGTWGNVARGILAAGGTSRLALLAAGTGNDLSFAARLDVHDIDTALAIARGSGERRIDVGEVDGVHFVNCVGFGFDAEVVRETMRVTWLRGHAVYLLTAARLLFGYPGFEAALHVDQDSAAPGATPAHASPDATPRHLAVIVANGPRIGGGFLISPTAAVDDGLLDVVRVADVSPWRRAVVFSGAPRGAHLDAPEVTLRRARSLTLTFATPPSFEADGELHQARASTLVVRCLPGALRLAVP